MINLRIVLGAHILWIAGVIILILSPFIWWRGKRLIYLGLISLLVAFALIILDIRGRTTADMLEVIGLFDTPTANIQRTIDFTSAGGGIGLAYIHSETPLYETNRKSPVFVWDTSATMEYPQYRDPLIKIHGFQFTFLLGPTLRGDPIRDVVGIVVPSWFAFLMLTVPFCLGLRQLLAVRRRKKWRKTGRCVSCGYDMRATPDKCPECGWSPPAPKIVEPSHVS